MAAPHYMRELEQTSDRYAPDNQFARDLYASLGGILADVPSQASPDYLSRAVMMEDPVLGPLLGGYEAGEIESRRGEGDPVDTLLALASMLGYAAVEREGTRTKRPTRAPAHFGRKIDSSIN
tara:strand:- start:1235 stop:1600 length:366 start_codon:yes stop_codon:yes gene_type:complete